MSILIFFVFLRQSRSMCKTVLVAERNVVWIRRNCVGIRRVFERERYCGGALYAPPERECAVARVLEARSRGSWRRACLVHFSGSFHGNRKSFCCIRFYAKLECAGLVGRPLNPFENNV